MLITNLERDALGLKVRLKSTDFVDDYNLIQLINKNLHYRHQTIRHHAPGPFSGNIPRGSRTKLAETYRLTFYKFKVLDSSVRM